MLGHMVNIFLLSSILHFSQGKDSHSKVLPFSVKSWVIHRIINIFSLTTPSMSELCYERNHKEILFTFVKKQTTLQKELEYLGLATATSHSLADEVLCKK